MKATANLFGLGVAALLLTGTAWAQEEEGWLEGDYHGRYDNPTAEDDWFFDSYQPFEAEKALGLGGDWAGDELYAGEYDEGTGDDDWFYDSYADPGDEGIFDV